MKTRLVLLALACILSGQLCPAQTDEPATTNQSGRQYPQVSSDGRVRVVASGGETSSSGDQIAVRNADSALIFIAAATSFKKFDDVSGDPQTATKSHIATAVKKDYDTFLNGRWPMRSWSASVKTGNLHEDLLQGSPNHLRSFVGQIEATGEPYEPVLMTEDLYPL
jgi:hypothetical protein